MAKVLERTEKAIIAELVKQGLVEPQDKYVWEKKSLEVEVGDFSGHLFYYLLRRPVIKN